MQAEIVVVQSQGIKVACHDEVGRQNRIRNLWQKRKNRMRENGRDV
jgi:hypothetical protein